MKAIVEGKVMNIVPVLEFKGEPTENGEISLYQVGERNMCNVKFPKGRLPKGVTEGADVKLPVVIGSYVSKSSGQSVLTCRVI